MKFGIDFGTTSCAVVGIQDGQTFHYGIAGDRPFPSVVAINKESGEIYTGETARDKRIELSESCYYIPSIKSMLDDQEKEWSVKDKVYKPIDIASELFKSMKANVERTADFYKLEEAVVSIPIGFSSTKRNILRQAASMAGIHITS